MFTAFVPLSLSLESLHNHIVTCQGINYFIQWLAKIKYSRFLIPVLNNTWLFLLMVGRNIKWGLLYQTNKNYCTRHQRKKPLWQSCLLECWQVIMSDRWMNRLTLNRRWEDLHKYVATESIDVTFYGSWLPLGNRASSHCQVSSFSGTDYVCSLKEMLEVTSVLFHSSFSSGKS